MVLAVNPSMGGIPYLQEFPYRGNPALESLLLQDYLLPFFSQDFLSRDPILGASASLGHLAIDLEAENPGPRTRVLGETVLELEHPSPSWKRSEVETGNTGSRLVWDIHKYPGLPYGCFCLMPSARSAQDLLYWRLSRGVAQPGSASALGATVTISANA